jgi:ligand-binding sensor domain-containing protein
LGFANFNTQNGLRDNDVPFIFQDRDGALWFGGPSGVSQYAGQTFTTYDIEDGLGHNVVNTIIQDKKGHFWFGMTGGVTLYDGKAFTHFTTEDGLPHNNVSSILQDREGFLWFATRGEGAVRYDGKIFESFNGQDGMAGNSVRSIYQDSKDQIWFSSEGGVSRYDGHTFTIFPILQDVTIQDGLGGNFIISIFEDLQGHLWFGARDGRISRYDGQAFTTFGTQDGVRGQIVTSILQDREGMLWFGNMSGIVKYDGEKFIQVSVNNSKTGELVSSIMEDKKGHLWFCTVGGGVIRYDGNVFQLLGEMDGLASNTTHHILQGEDGDFWIATSHGVTRFRPPERSEPPVFITAVVGDQRYENITELSLPSTVGLTTFEFHCMSFKTRPDQVVYQYRLKGYEEDWQTTRERRIEYLDLPRGTYIFEVVAIDRDLGYSKSPATVMLEMHMPYERIGFLLGLSIAFVLVVWQTIRVVRRGRSLQIANRHLILANQEIQEQTKRKSAFLASMSHELRTPMNAIKGFTNLVLRREKDLSDRNRENLTKVTQASDHLLAMIIRLWGNLALQRSNI